MRNIMKKALCAAFLALTFCGRAFAEPAGTVALPQSMQTRKLIVNLVVVAAVLLVYYGKKMKMYRTGDVKANIAAYMAQKNYGKRESGRDRVRRMNSEMETLRRMREELQQQDLSDAETRRQMEMMQRQMEEQAKELARRGGYIDITSGIREQDGFTNCIKPSEAIRICMEEGVPMEQITMSSDGNGSMSVPLPDGGAKLLVTRLSSLHEEVRDAVKAGVPVEKAIRICGENPARANGLFPKKGCIRPGSDADLVILDEEFLVDTVFARGQKMVEYGKALVKGTFETD